MALEPSISLNREECSHPKESLIRDSAHGMEETFCGLCGLVLDEEKFEDSGYSYKHGTDVGSFVGRKNTRLRMISDRSALSHKEATGLRERKIIASMTAALGIPTNLLDEQIEILLSKYRAEIRNHIPLRVLFPVLIYLASIDMGFSVSPYHIRKPFGIDRKGFFRALRQIRRVLGRGVETSAEPFLVAAADRAEIRLSPPVFVNAKKIAQKYSGKNMPSGVSPSILALAIIFICLWEDSYWLPLTSFCETANTSTGVIRRALAKLGYNLDSIIARGIKPIGKY